jgi:putative tricarboxylic transport membrane protein
MNRYDSITSVIWLLAALGMVFWSSLTLSMGTLRHPGPGFLPVLSGMIMAFLAIIVLLQAKRKKEQVTGDPFRTNGSLTRVLVMVGTLVVYALVLERLGFIVSTFFLMLLIVTQVARASWLTGMAESSIATGASYLLFGYFLRIPLPKGWFGI